MISKFVILTGNVSAEYYKYIFWVMIVYTKLLLAMQSVGSRISNESFTSI